MYWPQPGQYFVNFWTAAEDEEVEGEFVNYYSKEPMQYIPWHTNRPYPKGETHNCMSIRLHIPFKNNTEMKDTLVQDNTCEDTDRANFAVCVVPRENLQFFSERSMP